MANNLATVNQMFASFGQGDVPGVIACLADNVTFTNTSNPNKTPIGGTYHGKDGAMEYFQRLGGNNEIKALVPTNFVETAPNEVLHDVHEEGVVRANGNPYSIDMQFKWTFDEGGKVIDWKATGDFSNLEAAY